MKRKEEGPRGPQPEKKLDCKHCGSKGTVVKTICTHCGCDVNWR
jgi:Rieske Fe-S protein